MEINPSIEDHTLTGHVFKSMVIQDSSACDVNCFIENDCVSFNIKPLLNEDYLCELSNSCDVVHPEDLKEEQGTVYTSFKVRAHNYLTLLISTLSGAHYPLVMAPDSIYSIPK